MEKICKNVEETVEAGRELARSLSRGAVISLEGELGAGKTHFVKGIAAELNVKDVVSSPTFTLLHEYAGCGFPLFHLDFYRLESAQEAVPLGLEDCFTDGITVIEWGNKFTELLPASARRIRFEILPDGARKLWEDN